jgi:hypothetical protein
MAGKTKGTTTKKPRRTTPAKKAVPAVAELTPAPKVRRKKSIFQAGTWIAVLLLIALLEFNVYFNREKEKAVIEDVTPISEVAAIFADGGIVSSIEINTADGETVKVARNAEKVWAVETPTEAEADQGLAEAAAAQVSALQVVSPIADGKSPSDFGLDNPAYVITVEFEGGEKRMLEVGDATPTNSGYYVRVDKDKMMITDLSGIDALTQLVFFPPYLSTPAP